MILSTDDGYFLYNDDVNNESICIDYFTII